jgi:hypothetical protein
MNQQAHAGWLQDLWQNLFNSNNKNLSRDWIPAGILTITVLLMRNLYNRTKTKPLHKKEVQEPKISTEPNEKPLPKVTKEKKTNLIPKTSKAKTIIAELQPEQERQLTTITSSVATLFNSPKEATSFVETFITINNQKYKFFGLYQGQGLSGVQLIKNLQNYLHRNIEQSGLSIEDAIQGGIKKTGGQLIQRNTSSAIVIANNDEINFANIGNKDKNPRIVVIDKKNNVIVFSNLNNTNKDQRQEDIHYILITTPSIPDLLKKIGKYQRYQENPRQAITPTTPEVLEDLGTQTTILMNKTGFSPKTAQNVLENIKNEEQKLPQSNLKKNNNMALMIIKLPEK